MRAFVVFGSKSDSHVYDQVLLGLKSIGVDYDFEVASAHRDPKKLEELLKALNYDIVIAGAGLAAHLPGVVASQVKVPVIGIPISANFMGLDSFLSIVQMPYGVPVLSSGADKLDPIFNFLKNIRHEEINKEVSVVCSDELFATEIGQREWGRISDLKNEINLEVERSTAFDDKKINLCFLPLENKEEGLRLLEEGRNKCCIYTPLTRKVLASDPRSAYEFFELAEVGGLWSGLNNTRNALLLANKFFEEWPNEQLSRNHLLGVSEERPRG
jgi:5-(carboxyamino)imidazole ribonucleotide mutase